MANLQEVFNRIQKTKQEQKEIKSMYKDALTNSQVYQKTVEELKEMKEKKKKIEDQIREDFRHEFDKLENLKADIENDNLLLSDAALTKLMKGETVEVVDDHENRYEPVFSVRFKRS